MNFAQFGDRSCDLHKNAVVEARAACSILGLAARPWNDQVGDPMYELIDTDGGVPIKAWTRGVGVEDSARKQLQNVAQLPIVYPHVAVMPDVHFGIGATVG